MSGNQFGQNPNVGLPPHMYDANMMNNMNTPLLPNLEQTNNQNYAPQPGYPPQQGYPTQQGYPPQQGYPTQQGYPPQQGYTPQQGYPPQQQFPPQGQTYQPIGQAYPPQGYAPQPTNNIVIVQNTQTTTPVQPPVQQTQPAVVIIQSENTDGYPKLSAIEAILVLILNIFLPGIGTIVMGCLGNASHSGWICIGICQLLLTMIIIGWIWAIITGLMCLKFSKR